MAKETMMPKERMQAAINLETPDRVPVCPLVGVPAAAGLLGLNLGELHADPNRAIEALLRAFEEFGGWDAVNFFPNIALLYNLGGLAVKVPGKDLPDNYQIQFDEKETLTVEDYKKIADAGWRDFVVGEYISRISDIKPADIPEAWKKLWTLKMKCNSEWDKRSVALKMSTEYLHPFFTLSLNRSLLKFTEDLYYRPKLVEPALEVMTEEMIEFGIRSCKRSGDTCIYVAEERAEAYFYPLKIFERFWWPYTKRMVEAWYSEGIVTWLHLDQCWDKNLHYFKELPKASAIIDLDGLTDIFAAKKVLLNHLCISSDVHPSLLSLGKPEDVEAYCKKLIDKLGVDGGHILCSGCEVPAACKRENLRAMIETGKTYQLSKI